VGWRGTGRGGRLTDTRLICGHFTFAEGLAHPLLGALPDLLVLTAERRATEPWLDELLRLIAGQVFAARPGATAAVIRLSEAMFIEAVRACADQEEGLARLLAAMADPRLGRAVALVHRRPEAAWTVATLAREAGMSRSRFAAEFLARIGTAPMAYLAELRLAQARRLLARGVPVGRAAAAVGYRSAAAFSRAFAQRFGTRPKDARTV
jgi:transcriptional regulator GlxA family with amidase domain